MINNKKLKILTILVLCLIVIIAPVAIKNYNSVDKVITELTKNGSQKFFFKNIDEYNTVVIANSVGDNCDAYVVYNNYLLGSKITSAKKGYVSRNFDTFNKEKDMLQFFFTTIFKSPLQTNKNQKGYLIFGAFDNRFNIDDISYNREKMQKIDIDGVSIFWIVSDTPYSPDMISVTYNN